MAMLVHRMFLNHPNQEIEYFFRSPVVAQQQLIGWVYHIPEKKWGFIDRQMFLHLQCNEISEHTHTQTHKWPGFSNVIQRDRQKDVR